MAREIFKNKKNLYVWFRINCENISNNAFCLIKLNGLKEKCNFDEIAPKAPKCAFKLRFEGVKVLLVCVFLISRKRLFLNSAPWWILNKILNGLIDCCWNVYHACLIMLTILFESFISIDTVEHLNLSMK